MQSSDTAGGAGDLNQIRRELADVSEAVARLGKRLADYEQALARQAADSSATAEAAAGPPPSPIFVAAPPPAPPQPPGVQPPPPPMPPQAATAPGYIGGLEALVGGRWSQWMGILLVFLALAWALGYSWQYLGNNGRVLVALSSGIGFLALGAVARSSSQRWFSEGLSGAGIAILYLTVWAASARYNMLSGSASYAAMIAVTGLGVALAIIYDAISLMVLADLGAFLTPAVLGAKGGGGGAGPLLLAYLAAVDAGVVAVSLWKRWPSVIHLALAGTVALVGGWAAEHYREPMRWQVLWFVTAYFLLFTFAAIFRIVYRRQASTPSELLTLFGSSFAYAIAGYLLLAEPLGRYPGLFHALLACLLAALGAALAARRPEDSLLVDCCNGLAVFFVAVAIPVQLGGSGMVLGWAVQAVVLAVLSMRHSSVLFWVAGCVVEFIAALASTTMGVPPVTTGALAGFNLSVAAAAASAAIIALLAHRRGGNNKDQVYPLAAVWSVLAGAWVISSFVVSRIWGQEGAPGPEVYARCLLLSSCFLSLYALAVDYATSRSKLLAFQLTGLLVMAGAAAAAVIGGAKVFEAGSFQAYTPLWNIRLLAFATSALALGLAGHNHLKDREAGAMPDQVTSALLAFVALGIAIGLSFEAQNTMVAYYLPSAGPVTSASMCVMSVIWALVALPSLVAGRKMQSETLVVTAIGMALVGAVLWLAGASVTTAALWEPFLNFRFLPLVGYLAFCSVLVKLAGDLEGDLQIAPAATGAFSLFVALWGLTQETFAACLYYQPLLGTSWQLVAQMCISVVWTLFAVGLLVVGIWKSWRGLRIAGLGLLAITVIKVFTLDLSFLEMPYRVLSFGCLGIALIGISWLYSHYGVGQPQAGPELQAAAPQGHQVD